VAQLRRRCRHCQEPLVRDVCVAKVQLQAHRGNGGRGRRRCQNLLAPAPKQASVCRSRPACLSKPGHKGRFLCHGLHARVQDPGVGQGQGPQAR
jgi:hypothetical protein